MLYLVIIEEFQTIQIIHSWRVFRSCQIPINVSFGSSFCTMCTTLSLLVLQLLLLIVLLTLLLNFLLNLLLLLLLIHLLLLLLFLLLLPPLLLPLRSPCSPCSSCSCLLSLHWTKLSLYFYDSNWTTAGWLCRWRHGKRRNKQRQSFSWTKTSTIIL